jgi:Helicase HerA-like C-terminal
VATTAKPGFAGAIAGAYATRGNAVELGQGVLDGQVVHEAAVRLPPATRNRHGLIAGATGTGKTRTLQAPPHGDTLTDFLTSRQGKALRREVVRGVFGLLRKRL